MLPKWNLDSNKPWHSRGATKFHRLRRFLYILCIGIAIACQGTINVAHGRTDEQMDGKEVPLMGILDSDEVVDKVRREAKRPDHPAFQMLDTNFPTGWIPQRTTHMVNDYTGILTTKQRQALERRLLDCEDSSGVQILLLVTPDLGGDEIANFTQRVWENWGVGDKKLNNGLIIVVKPKNSTNGHLGKETG